MEHDHDEEMQSTETERSPSPPQRGEICADHPLATRIEAMLLSTDRPMTEKRLAELLGLTGKEEVKRVREAITDLNDAYDKTGRSFRIENVAGGYQVLTLPAFGGLLARLHADRQSSRLSQAALETLSIVAYRQPIMRAEIEAIRGVACGEVLRSLMERRMVKIVGRAEELGRPMLYGTTRQFLKVFGLANLDDLPAVEGLQRSPAYKPPKQPKGTTTTVSEEATDDAEAELLNEIANVGESESNGDDDQMPEIVVEADETRESVRR